MILIYQNRRKGLKLNILSKNKLNSKANKSISVIIGWQSIYAMCHFLAIKCKPH